MYSASTKPKHCTRKRLSGKYRTVAVFDNANCRFDAVIHRQLLSGQQPDDGGRDCGKCRYVQGGLNPQLDPAEFTTYTWIGLLFKVISQEKARPGAGKNFR